MRTYRNAAGRPPAGAPAAPLPVTGERRGPPGREFRTFPVVRSEVDVENRTVPLAFSSEAAVERWWGVEILGHASGEADLSWLESGRAALLMDHNPTDQVGVVADVTLGTDRTGRAVVRFGRSARAEEIFQDIQDGIRTNVSVGYDLLEIRLESEKDGIPTYRATRWRPFEISIVAIPADISVGVGRSDGDAPPPIIVNMRSKMDEEDENKNKGADGTENCGDNDGDEGRSKPNGGKQRSQPAAPRSQPTPADVRASERSRSTEIFTIGQRFNMPGDVVQTAITEGTTVDAFRAQVLERQAGGSRPLQTPATELGMSHRDLQDYSLLRAVRAAVRHDWSGAGLELEASRAIEQRLKREARGFFVPYDVLTQRRELSAGTPSAGGNLVATQLQAGSFIDLLRNRMMVTQLGAQLLSGLIGNVDISKLTGGATAYWLGESDPVTESDQTFGKITLSPKTVAAKTQLTRRLMLQSTPDVEMLIRNDLIQALGLAIDLAAISGTGSANQPRGILNTSGIGLVVLGTDGAPPTFGTMIDLETEVSADNADIGNLAYLTNAKVRGKLKQAKKDPGSGEFVWTQTAGQTGMGEVNGYKSGTTNQVASNLTKGSGTGLSAAIFGNWADLIIGEWGVLDIQVDPYTSGDDGGTILRAFQDVDIGVRHPESFAAAKDIVA